MRIGALIALHMIATSVAGAALGGVAVRQVLQAFQARDAAEASKLDQERISRIMDGTAHLIQVGDLVLTGGTTYLAPVAAEQRHALLEQLAAVAPSLDLDGGTTLLQLIRSDIDRLGSTVVDAAELTGAERESDLSRLCLRFDDTAMDVVDRLEAKSEQGASETGVSLAAAEHKQLLAIQVASVAALAFFLFLLGMWRSLHSAICRPLVSLASAAQRAADSNEFVALNHGPYEVKTLSDSLIDLVSGLQVALASRAAFLGNTSHELRTPLNAILGYSQLLADPTIDTEEREEGLRSIESSGRHLLSLIEDVLDFSKIDAGHMSIESVPVEVRTVVDDVVRMLAEKAAKSGVALTVTIDEGVPAYVLSDSVRLRQILVNLANNALKFTEAGEVGFRANWAAGQLKIDVHDTGIGIAPDRIEAIFGAFQQADDSSTRLYGGTGLGLAISRKLAELMGGELTATSVVHEGSTFTMTAAAPRSFEAVPSPLSHSNGTTTTPSADAVGSSGNPVPTSTGSVRVLLVDDAAINRKIGQKLLERIGFEVETADDGQQALERVSDASKAGGAFDALLMDLQMPVMNGYDATEALRAQGYTGVVLALSAAVMPEDQTRALAAGCDGFVSKPFQASELAEAIRSRLVARTA